MRHFSLGVIILFLLFQTACVMQKNPISGQKRAYGYSWEEEVKLGQQSDKQIVAQYGLLQDEDLAAYVDSLGQDILSYSHLRRDDTPKKYRETPFTFRVLNTPVVNAFALPGGYVYITRGLLNHLNNEAQLAVVLGHEIGHVAARHASQRALEQKAGQFALIGGAVVGEQFGFSAQNVMQLGGQAAQLLFMSYSRDDERESDRVGVEYAAMAGYKAEEAAGFFESLKRLSEQSGNGTPTLLSSHPDPGNRYDSMFELAEKWEEKGYVQTKVKTNAYKNRVAGLTYGNNPREGFTQNNTFYHPDLAFQFDVPQGWNVQNQPTQVVLFNNDQNAIMQFTLAQDATSPGALVSSFLSQEGITSLSNEAIRVNGFPAQRGTATAVQENSTLWIQFTAVEKDGQIYQFLAYTAEQSKSQFEPAFSSISGSFARVTNESILSIQPPVVRLVRTNSAQPFDQIANQQAPDYDLTTLAILNQVETNEQIPAGTLLKFPKN